MQLPAKLIQQLPIQSGTSINGPWSRQTIIVETTDEYPKKVCISIWNGKVDISKLEVGKEYTFHCNIESKEYKGKWYTEVTLWKIDRKIRNPILDKFNDEPDFPDVDIDELAKRVVSSRKGGNLNDFLRQSMEETVIDKEPEQQEPDFSKAVSSGIAENLPENLRRHLEIDNPDTSSSKTGDFDKPKPDIVL